MVVFVFLAIYSRKILKKKCLAVSESIRKLPTPTVFELMRKNRTKCHQKQYSEFYQTGGYIANRIVSKIFSKFDLSFPGEEKVLLKNLLFPTLF